MNDKQVICLLKAEITDLQDQLDGASIPSVECMDDLNLAQMKRRAVTEAIRRAGTITGAAKLLGIHRTSLQHLAPKYGLKTQYCPDIC